MSAAGWTAIHDHQGIGPRTLRVRGTVMLPTPDYTNVTLVPAEPQGFNPLDLLLRLGANPPTHVVTQVMTAYDVEYFVETEVEYETVSIVPEGPVGIEVQHVE